MLGERARISLCYVLLAFVFALFASAPAQAEVTCSGTPAHTTGSPYQLQQVVGNIDSPENNHIAPVGGCAVTGEGRNNSGYYIITYVNRNKAYVSVGLGGGDQTPSTVQTSPPMQQSGGDPFPPADGIYTITISHHIGDELYTMRSVVEFAQDWAAIISSVVSGGVFDAPVLSVSPAGPLSFGGNEGSGSYGAPQTFSVSNSRSGTLNYSVSVDQSWLAAVITSGDGSITTENETVTVSINAAVANTLPPGSYNGTVTFNGGSAGTITRNVTLTIHDVTPPVIADVSGDVEINTDPGKATGFFSWNMPTASDNVDVTGFTVALSGAATVGPQPAASLTGFDFPLGVTTVTYEAEDAASNKATKSFTVTVVDNEAPVIGACPADQTLEATGPSGAMANWIEPTATDNSGNVSLSRTGPAPGATFPLGTTTVSYTAQDPSENAAAPCTFDIVVQDTTPPTIDPISNIVVTAPDLMGADVSFPLPTATDVVDTSVEVTTDPVSGSFFSIGEHVVHVTATDDSGNKSTSSFTIVVQKPAALEVAPGTDFVAKGPQGQKGGTFAPSSQAYTVTNNGDVAMDFTVEFIANAPSWITLSSTGGVLQPGASTTITVSINPDSAAGLPVGTYDATVAFKNVTSGIGDTTRSVKLTVQEPAALVVTPADAFLSSGPQGQQGGAFTPASTTFKLENTGALPLSFTIAGAPAWVDVAPMSGTIAPGDSTLLSVSLNSAADALSVGVHNATLAFNNTTNGIGSTTRAITLTVNEPARLDVSPASGLVASGYAGGPFSPSSQTFQVSNPGSYDLDFALSIDKSWLDIAPKSGTIPAGGSTTVTLSINGAAHELPSGTHNATLQIVNTTNDLGSTTRPVTLTVIPNGRVILRVVTSEGDGQFTFSSSTSALNLAIATTNGVAQSSPIVLNPGSYDVTITTPSGYGLTSVTCSDDDSAGDVSARSAHIVLASAETVTCTFAAVNSGKRTVEIISRFMTRRNSLLLANGPDPNRQIDRLNAADGSSGAGAASFDKVDQLTVPSPLVRHDPTASIGALWTPGSTGLSRSIKQHISYFHGDDPMGSSDTSRASSPFLVNGSTDGADRFSFATSLSQMLRYSAETENARVKDLLGDGAMGLGATTVPATASSFIPFDVWAEGRYMRFADDREVHDVDGHFSVLYLGADYVFNRYLLLGALVQLDSMYERSFSEGFEMEGKGWMAGPYATVRLSENLFLQSRAAFGRSTNKVSPFLTYTDTFSSRRWLASATLVGSWTFDNLQFRPKASIAYIEDRSEGYVDSLGVPIPGIRRALGQAKAGPEFAYRFEYADGSVIEPRVSLEAIWNFDASNGKADFGDTLAGPEEIRGRVELGIRATSADGYAVEVSGSYDGLGSDEFRSIGGKAMIRLPLN